MGNEKSIISNNNDFCPFKVSSFYVDIDESINKKSKIDTIVEYFMKQYHSKTAKKNQKYNLDVLCLQGIRNYNILKEIICTFKDYVNKCNNDNSYDYKDAIYLEYFPDIELVNNKQYDNNMYWSTSESHSDMFFYNKLIITKHRILQSSNKQIGTEQKNYAPTSIYSKTIGDSDESINMQKYVQIVNLNVDGNFVSIYNIDIESDIIGISNKKERRNQLRDISETIEMNRREVEDEITRQFNYGNKTYIAENRNLHIVVGMFRINEIKNGVLSSEYNKMCHMLNALDTHRWICTLRKDEGFYTTNAKFTKDTYILLVSNDVFECENQDTKAKSIKLFSKHKVVIVNSKIAKNVVDMNQFVNYPEETYFMLYKPNIKTRRINDLRASYTTKFIDQIHSCDNTNLILPNIVNKLNTISTITNDISTENQMNNNVVKTNTMIIDNIDAENQTNNDKMQNTNIIEENISNEQTNEMCILKNKTLHVRIDSN